MVVRCLATERVESIAGPRPDVQGRAGEVVEVTSYHESHTAWRLLPILELE